MTSCAAERALGKDPAQYVISLQQMVENDYPIPSYMADIFQKPPGWVETPEAPKEPLLSSSTAKKPKIYAIDCEMVGASMLMINDLPITVLLVLDRRWQRTHESLHHRLHIGNRDL